MARRPAGTFRSVRLRSFTPIELGPIPHVSRRKGAPPPPRGRGRAWQGALMLAAPPRGIYLRHPSLASIWGTHLGSARSELPKSNPWAPCPGIEPPGAQGDLAPWTAPGPQRQRGLRPRALAHHGGLHHPGLDAERVRVGGREVARDHHHLGGHGLGRGRAAHALPDVQLIVLGVYTSV